MSLIKKSDFTSNYVNRGISDPDATKEEVVKVFRDSHNPQIRLLCKLHPNGQDIYYSVKCSEILRVYDTTPVLTSIAPWFFNDYSQYKIPDEFNNSTRDILTYISITNFLSSEENLIKDTYQIEDVPYAIIELLIQNGTQISSSLFRALMFYKNNGKFPQWVRPIEDKVAFFLIDSFKKQSNYDPRLEYFDEQRTEQFINFIFEKIKSYKFIYKLDMDYLKVLNDGFTVSDNIKRLIMSKLDGYYSTGEDPKKILGDSSSFLFKKNPSKIDLPEPSAREIAKGFYENDDLHIVKTYDDDAIYDDDSDKYNRKRIFNGEFKISGLVLGDIEDSDNGLEEIITDDEINSKIKYFKMQMEHDAKNVFEYEKYENIIEILDAKLNKINNYPGGLYVIYTKKSSNYDEYDASELKHSELIKHITIKRIVFTGDNRNISYKDISEKISGIYNHTFDINYINDYVVNVLNNLPTEKVERNKYLEEKIYHNPIFKKFLYFVAHCMYRNEYRTNELYKEAITNAELFLYPLIQEVRNKLTQEEILYLLKSREPFNIESFGRHEKLLLTANTTILDSQHIVQYFDQQISESDFNYRDDTFKKFTSADVHAPAVQKYFDDKYRQYKFETSKKGQDIFNDGINADKIKTTYIKDYPETIDFIQDGLKSMLNNRAYINDTNDLINRIQDIPVYIVDRHWLYEKMNDQGLDRFLSDSTIRDFKGIFCPFLNSVNCGKPFIMVYNEPNEATQEIKDIFNIKESNHFNEVVGHEAIHAVQFKLDSILKQNDIDYEDPWLEDPVELEAIIMGNVPYLDNIIRRRVTELVNNPDKRMLESLMDYMVEDINKIEYFQIDQIAGKTNKTQEQTNEIKQSSFDDLKYQEELMRDIVSQELFNEGQTKEIVDKEQYINNITDDLLQVVLTKWFKQYNINAFERLGAETKTPEELTSLIKMELEQARTNELKKIDQEEKNRLYKEQYQTYGRESLEKILQEPEEIEKEFINQVFKNDDFKILIKSISLMLNEIFKDNKEKYNVYFYSNENLKVPPYLDSIIPYIQDKLDFIQGFDKYKYTVGQFSSKLRSLEVLVNDLIKQRNTLYRNTNKQIQKKQLDTGDTKYHSDELKELVDLLVDMRKHGPQWMYVAYPIVNKKYGNVLTKLTKFCKSTDNRIEIVDEEHVKIKDLNSITEQEYQKINDFLIRRGYDVRGMEDIKLLLEKSNNAARTKEWSDAILYGLGINKNLEEKSKLNSKNIINKIIKMFGTTWNYKQAGFILPDGSLVDLSGDGRNTRGLDHTEINFVSDKLPGGYKGLIELMKIGIIRYVAEANSIQFSLEPTQQQYNTISKMILYSNGEFRWEVVSSSGIPLKSMDYTIGTKPYLVLAHIKNYFNQS